LFVATQQQDKYPQLVHRFRLTAVHDLWMGTGQAVHIPHDERPFKMIEESLPSGADSTESSTDIGRQVGVRKHISAIDQPKSIAKLLVSQIGIDL